MAAQHTSRPRPGTSFRLINFLSGSTPPKSAKRKRLPSNPRKKSSSRRGTFFFFYFCFNVFFGRFRTMYEVNFFTFFFHARKADSALARNPPFICTRWHPSLRIHKIAMHELRVSFSGQQDSKFMLCAFSDSLFLLYDMNNCSSTWHCWRQKSHSIDTVYVVHVGP